MLESLGLASRSGQRPYHQPVGVLAHVVERDGALAGLQRLFGTASGQILFAEPHHGAKGKIQQSLAFTSQPFVPALLAYANVVDQPTPVEIGCRAQRIPATVTDQGLELADVASDGRRIERYDLTIALQSVLAEHFAQPEQSLAQVLPGLRVEAGAPQQGRQLLTRLRPGRVAGQIGQQACKLLARQVDHAIRSGQLKASQQRKTKFWKKHAVHWRTRNLHDEAPPRTQFLRFSWPSEQD